MQVAQKVFGVLAQLRRNFAYIPPKTRQILINALALPHINYGSILFTDMSMGNNLKLQRVQNACIRFISGAKCYDHVTPIYNSLRIRRIVESRNYYSSVNMESNHY